MNKIEIVTSVGFSFHRLTEYKEKLFLIVFGKMFVVKVTSIQSRPAVECSSSVSIGYHGLLYLGV
jgi:hypothetical protein